MKKGFFAVLALFAIIATASLQSQDVQPRYPLPIGADISSDSSDDEAALPADQIKWFVPGYVGQLYYGENGLVSRNIAWGEFIATIRQELNLPDAYVISVKCDYQHPTERHMTSTFRAESNDNVMPEEWSNALEKCRGLTVSIREN